MLEKVIYKVKDINIDIHKNDKVINVTGALGSLKKRFSGSDIIFDDNKVLLKSKTSYGTFKSLLNNMLSGVARGYFLELQFVGLGYKFINLKNSLLLKVGYTHYIKYEISKSVKIVGYKNRILIFGLDLEEVNRIGSGLRALKVPDNYKGKGIRYLDEVVKIKIGKQR